uniref:Transposase n=1 Tax=Strongyloides papillosus TaxID=174720 RepID=A0A0N5BBZ6_STREA
MKTELMCLDEVKIKSLDGTKIKQVQQFTYLGAQVSFSNQEYKEVLVRKKKMWSVYHFYKNEWKKLKDKDKRRLTVQILFSIATYGAQAWQLLKNTPKQLQGTINHI